MMTTDILRKKFLDFFQARKHKIVESDSLVPADDPTVLFTPAGMNQFKKEFLGYNCGFTRAASSQRCLRTDDLDKVGKTSGHHTFFEMLGNFSFGDYFKKEAIAWAWEFLTQELKIKKENLWVSVYKDDQEAYSIWKDIIKVPEERIVKLGDKENFWPSEAKTKGPNGPCGPCSEIFFDPDGQVESKNSVEVWNLVFTQYNRKESGVLQPLPKKNIDTGMGLERLAAVMQGAKNNFETDLFQPIIKEIIAAAKRSPNNENIYAVSDHLRAIVFAIYDGVLPSNDGRGYIVRKLIRKSALHLGAMGIKGAFLYKLVPLLAEIMQEPYPELGARQENIAQVILSEEKNFLLTLNTSENLFKEKFADRRDPGEAGRIAFTLYDTYGIPLEFTKEWLDKQGIKFSRETFEKELKEQKERSKIQSTMKGDVFGARKLHLDVKETKFLGYKDFETKAKIIKIIKDDSEAKKITQGDKATIILEKTSFYAEAGGQVGDSGEIIKGKNIFSVQDTKKAGKAIIHLGVVKAGTFKKSDLVLAKVDQKRRMSIARNHTATHLLQAALRKVLGGHVKQQGSLVAENKLRFDFTHFKDINDEELNRIEEIVNDYIINNSKVEVKEKPLSQAKKSGALAFFGEKYESKVRVVTVGDISRELCAGTHLDSTGQIGIFRIIQEGSVASGIRRIEATTGSFAYKMSKEKEQSLAEKARQEAEKREARIRELEKQLNTQRLDTAKSSLDALIQNAQRVKEIKIISNIRDGLDINILRQNVDMLKEKTDNAVIALGTNDQGRALLVIGITADLCAKGLDANQLIRQVSAEIGGSGGGRKDFAQAGGSNPQGFIAAFNKLKDIINNLK